MNFKAGDKAPSLLGKDQNGELLKLEDFNGKKVVLYFYPKDNTPGCTAQACNLKDNYNMLLKAGYVVLGVSADTETKHQNFITKFDLPFPLIADTELALCKAYGVWQEKKNYGKTYMGIVRTTFIIDEDGVIEEVIEKIKTKEHTAQILK